MRRYLRIYRTFFATSFVRETEFRANFFAKLIQNMIWMGFFLAILLVVYGNTTSVAGWGKGDAIVLASTCFLMNALSGAFFMSVAEIPQHVRLGTLDFIVTKPIDSQFWVSSRRFNFDHAGMLVAGAALVVVGVRMGGLHPSAAQWLAYVALVLCSIAIFYSFMLALMTTGIWLVRVDNLWVLGESVMQVARFPLDIYQPGVQRLFTYALPLAFVATVPSRQLVVGLDWPMVGIGALWAVAFAVGSRCFWRFALRHYTSASS